VKSNDFMRRALTLAASQKGKTSPDPMVGAVIVKNGKIISEGYHSEPKTPHAEAWAIEKAGGKAKGATLYVNLEPCCFFETKNNPPCSEAIINAGIKKVVIAMVDPNPKVSGRGIGELKKAGIKVEVGLLGDEARKLNEVFVKYITTGIPFVTLKTAMTLDGKIATGTGDSFWVSGKEAQKYAHRLRVENDAVMVGIGTVKKDDPALTVRHVRGRNPLKIVVDPKHELSPKSKILSFEPEKALVCSPAKGGLKKLMKKLGKAKITSILLEGGGKLNASAIEEKIVDKVIFFIAPKIAGGEKAITPVEGDGIKKMRNALPIKHWSFQKIGADILVEGYL